MIFIPGNTPSMKNSRINVPGKGSFHSKACKNYLKSLGIKHFNSHRREVFCYKTRKNLFAESVGNYFENCKYPLTLGLHFVRDSKRIFDFVNASQIIFDLLVAHCFISDDNMKCLLPFPMYFNGEIYSIDRNKPGVYIKNWGCYGLPGVFSKEAIPV